MQYRFAVIFGTLSRKTFFLRFTKCHNATFCWYPLSRKALFVTAESGFSRQSDPVFILGFGSGESPPGSATLVYPGTSHILHGWGQAGLCCCLCVVVSKEEKTTAPRTLLCNIFAFVSLVSRRATKPTNEYFVSLGAYTNIWLQNQGGGFSLHSKRTLPCVLPYTCTYSSNRYTNAYVWNLSRKCFNFISVLENYLFLFFANII